MISVKVTYSVRSEFAVQNQANIAHFMQEFKQLGHLNFKYIVLLADDGKTFTHLSFYANEAIQQEILNINAFKKFQEARDESELEILPVVERVKTIGSSFQMLD